jgi:phage repressor protein C with HTH and peptisase S24 domain
MRLTWVAVSGPSMAPTLRHGDTVVVRTTGSIEPGDVVVARFRALPDRLVVKRAARRWEGGWWLVSDNTFAGGDSAAHGVADVVGTVVLRLRRGLPRRVHRRPPDVTDSMPRANPGTDS